MESRSGLELKMETQQQEWCRRAGRRSATDTGSAALSTGTNSHLYLSAGGLPVNTDHTVSSSKKIVRKSATQSINGHTKPSAAPIPPSRWKELRQSVRIKATMDTEERRVTNARIADLCEEDREKVARLIRRIVEIGTLQEEAEVEFSRQRDLYEAEIRELREQVKRDASELEDLSDKLKATLLKLRDYQERVLVLEESNDVETRYRLETDQTVDLLKMEVEKLRKLVQKQKEEMDLKDQEEQTKFKVELERVQQQLRDTQDELLHERRDRIQEKQRELDERLARFVANNASAVAVSEKAYSHENSSSSLSQVKQTESATIPSVPQLDMSSFLNTSIELPERIKDIMDEWKQRMEDAIAGTVRSIADQSRVMSNSTSQGIERPEGSHVDDEEEHSDGNARSDDENEGEHSDADHSHSYQDEPNSRSCRAREQSSRSVRRETLQLGSVPKVNRKPFDIYLSIESEVGSDAENERHESLRGREVTSQEEEEEEEEENAEEEQKQMRHTHQRRESERRGNRTECADGASVRPHRRHHRAYALKPSGAETRSQRQHRRQRERRDGDSQDEEGHHHYSRETSHIFEGDEDGELEKRERNRPSEVTLTGSVHSQPFVLINGGDQGGRSAGVNTSFSSLYETSLFDVVDAMEGSQVSIQASPSSQTSRSPQQHTDVVHSQHFDTEETDSSSSARLQSLLQRMQAREQKLARLGGNNNNLVSNRDEHQPTPTSDFNVDDGVDDFDIFNEVKDIYEKELFEFRQQREAWASTGGGGTASSTIFQHNLQLHSQPSPGLSDSRGSSLGPPLSQQDLSVREAIEKEMAELLQEEAFQELLH